MKFVFDWRSLIGALLLSTGIAQAAPINFSGTYSETFDGMPSSGTIDGATPGEYDVPTLPGWRYTDSANNGTARFRANDGSSNTGSTYSYGASGSSDRALGSLGSGTDVPFFGAVLQNATSSTITGLNLSYTGEQWRRANSGVQNRLTFHYSTDATSLTTGTYTPVSILDFAAVDFSNGAATGEATNGNSASFQSAVSGSIGGISWAPGSNLYIRWSDADNSGSDQGLAIDNLSVTSGSAPPPPPPPLDPLLTIMQIQGSGRKSTEAGNVVRTQGVVTAILASGSGYWIQDQTGDGSLSTSDGIFVAASAAGKSIGDLVEVNGTVQEQQFGVALSLTRMTSLKGSTVLSSGNALPSAILLDNLPDISIQDGIDFMERFEGMRVNVNNAKVVAPTNQFGEFSMLAPGNQVAGSGFESSTSTILVRSTGPNMVDYNPERIMVDDSTLGSSLSVRPGDAVNSLTGVLDYTFGNYKIQPTSTSITNEALPTSPVSVRHGALGNTTIATFNVENLFDTVNDPGDDTVATPAQLDLQLNKLSQGIISEMNLPAIIIAPEVENQAVLGMLGNRVNSTEGTNYVATSFASSDGRGIETGLLWDANRVSLVDAFQLTDAIVPGVSAAFGPGSASPGREPIVGIFDVNGHKLFVIGNHFKSKSGDNPLYGENDPPIRITEAQRKLQAAVVRAYVEHLFSINPNALILVGGDLNDFEFAEPSEGLDDPLSILRAAGLISLAEMTNSRYSFIFDGNSQVLDHLLISPALFKFFVGSDFLHFNTHFQASFGNDPSNPFQSSDHDPFEARFFFTTIPEPASLLLLSQMGLAGFYFARKRNRRGR